MPVNLRKFMQLIVFFAHDETVKPLGKTKLFKLLYFTDCRAFATVGQSITGESISRLPMAGPNAWRLCTKEPGEASTLSVNSVSK